MSGPRFDEPRFRRRLGAALAGALVLNVVFVVGSIAAGRPELLAANLTAVFLCVVGLAVLADAPRRWAVRRAGARRGYLDRTGR